MTPDDPGMLRQLLDWAWAGVLGLGALVYNRQREDMKEMQDSLHNLRNKVVLVEEFRAHEARDERDRKERRDSEITLFKKFDALKDDMNQRFDALKTLILEMRK